MENTLTISGSAWQIILYAVCTLIYFSANAFMAGWFCKYEEHNDFDWRMGLTVFAVLMLGVVFWAVSFTVSLIGWIWTGFLGVTQIKFWFSYLTGQLDKVSGKRLLKMNDNNAFTKAVLIKKGPLSLSRRHQFYCNDFLNKKYGFDYAKFKEEQKSDVFKEPNEFYTITK